MNWTVKHSPTKWKIVNNNPVVVVSMCSCGDDECHFTATAYEATNNNIDSVNSIKLRDF